MNALGDSDPPRRSTPVRWSLVTADVEGLPTPFVDDAAGLRRTLERAGLVPDAGWIEHGFMPRGASFVGTGREFRIVGHTWPERGALTLDLASTHPEAIDVLRRCVEALLAAARSGGAVASFTERA